MKKQSVWLAGALLLGFASFAAAEPPTPAPAAPPAAQAAPVQPTRAEVLQAANKLLVEGKFEEAEAEFHRAEALAGGPCGECALGLASVRGSEGKWDLSADMIQRALPLLTDPGSLARAYNQLGIAYVKGGDGADRLAKAEEAMRNAVDYGGPWGDIGRRNLAQILFLQERWADAVPVAREALEKAGGDEEAAKGARIILCQARSHLPDELPADTEPVRKVEGEVARPVKISGQPPFYTETARKANVEGVVIVESIIDREGCVRKVTALKELPYGLTEKTLQTLPLWVFSPATLDGKPVAVYYTLTVNFKVEAKPAGPAKP